MDTRLHWNYFLALEKDLERVSRYIEFCPPNFQVYSIELAHLLFAAASEVDTLAKCTCQSLNPSAKRDDMNDYRAAITQAEKDETYPVISQSSEASVKVKPEHRHRLSDIKVFIPHYSIELAPWKSWADGTKNPVWWRSYNHVKHQRDACFREVTLINAMNALGGLLAFNYYYCRALIPKDVRFHYWGKAVTCQLEPQSTFIRLREDYYDNLRKEFSEFRDGVRYGVHK